MKKARAAAQGDDAAVAQDAYRTATKKLDQAAARKLIHKNAASRTKSRLSRLLKANFDAQS